MPYGRYTVRGLQFILEGVLKDRKLFNRSQFLLAGGALGLSACSAATGAHQLLPIKSAAPNGTSRKASDFVLGLEVRYPDANTSQVYYQNNLLLTNTFLGNVMYITAVNGTTGAIPFADDSTSTLSSKRSVQSARSGGSNSVPMNVSADGSVFGYRDSTRTYRFKRGKKGLSLAMWDNNDLSHPISRTLFDKQANIRVAYPRTKKRSTPFAVRLRLGAFDTNASHQKRQIVLQPRKHADGHITYDSGAAGGRRVASLKKISDFGSGGSIMSFASTTPPSSGGGGVSSSSPPPLQTIGSVVAHPAPTPVPIGWPTDPPDGGGGGGGGGGGTGLTQAAACIRSAVYASGLTGILTNYAKFQAAVANFILDNILVEAIVEFIPVVGEIQDAVLAAVEIGATAFTVGVAVADIIGFIEDVDKCMTGGG
jgi:hypothetical protein